MGDQHKAANAVGRLHPAAERTKRRWQAKRLRLAFGLLIAALTPASMLLVKGETPRSLGLLLMGGCLLGLLVGSVAPAADRLIMARRCAAAGAAFAGSATMRTQSNPPLSGVLWVIDDKAGCEIGWEPARRVKRKGVRPLWFTDATVARIELGSGRSGELLIERTDGSTLDFSVSDLRRLHNTLLATPLARTA